jgi:hypothetical protein
MLFVYLYIKNIDFFIIIIVNFEILTKNIKIIFFFKCFKKFYKKSTTMK